MPPPNRHVSSLQLKKQKIANICNGGKALPEETKATAEELEAMRRAHQAMLWRRNGLMARPRGQAPNLNSTDDAVHMPVAHAEAKSEVPFHKKPSVGTWAMSLPLRTQQAGTQEHPAVSCIACSKFRQDGGSGSIPTPTSRSHEVAKDRPWWTCCFGR
eukprot:CAMPEP_0178373836 /NCGR_PEP_ID=MMETSP0689_2-20121128/2068_1 /TAXON_ID=160604 /ORGANISM="Amphidinium massartii, Strain CS-259" /LENGTH=157 /DNA_ID=CAMNT_0019993791 /DNA_START=56 /DNA_END=529 /DNA_ORIENTATION=-